MPEGADQGREAYEKDIRADFYDPVIEAYKKDVDRTILRENLKLTPAQRVKKAESMHRSIEKLRGAARRAPDAGHRREES
jgi:hypothetical protein